MPVTGVLTHLKRSARAAQPRGEQNTHQRRCFAISELLAISGVDQTRACEDLLDGGLGRLGPSHSPVGDVPRAWLPQVGLRDRLEQFGEYETSNSLRHIYTDRPRFSRSRPIPADPPAAHMPRSVRPGSSAGRGPGAVQVKRRSANAIATSLMLASRRRINPCSSNSHCSLP